MNFSKLSRIRQKLLELGANTLATLPKIFKSKPSFDNINVQYFFEGLKIYHLHIIKEETVRLCRYFYESGTEKINFETISLCFNRKNK